MKARIEIHVDGIPVELLAATVAVFSGTGARASLRFGKIELEIPELGGLLETLGAPGPADPDDLRDGLERAVAELRRRDRRSRRAESPLVDELEDLLR